jgi:hypothetical protein
MFCAPLIVLTCVALGDDSARQRAARIENMTAEQKEELLRKKQRFEELSKEDQDRLRVLHEAIARDPQAQQLEETAKRFNRWLATLSSPQRAALLDIQDPQERIARIKEVMQQQQEQRFRDFLPTLSQEDREAVRNWLSDKWLADFVMRHEEAVAKNMSREVRDRLNDLPQDDPRRREMLMGSWKMQYARNEPETPVPNQPAIDELLASLSAETRQQLTQPPMDEQRQARVRELVRAAVWSRSPPQVTREELLKFYEGMKSDDPRRERLEGREGDDLYRELMRMWSVERMDRWRKGGAGPPGPRGGTGEPPGGKILIKRRPDDGEPPPPPPRP